MKILVTGCAGFVGTNLVKRLLKLGHTVVGIDNFTYGYEKNMGDINFGNYIKGDIRGIEAVENTPDELQKTDMIYHQANLRKNIASKYPLEDISITIEGTRRLLDWAVETKVKKFVYASSSMVYGEVEDIVDEKSKLNPMCQYGCSKVASEKLVGMYSQIHKLDTVIFRYFQGYGPYQDTTRGAPIIPTIIRNIIKKEPIVIHGDGKQVRAFTWIEDIVDVLELPQKERINGIFNVTAGIRYTINEIVDMIIEAFGGKADSEVIYDEAFIDDAMQIYGDNSKIRECGITFNTNIRENLKKTVEFYKGWL